MTAEPPLGHDSTMPARSGTSEAIRAAAKSIHQDRASASASAGDEVGEIADVSLIQGKTPPPVTTSYLEHRNMASGVQVSTLTRAPMPRWFVGATLAAVVIAVAIVLLLLFVTAGSSS